MADLKLSPTRLDPKLGIRVVPELSQKQRELLAVVLLLAALKEPRILVLGCLGEWGGGKSMIAFIIFLVLCLLNSDPDQTDPDLLPCSGIWAKTEDDAKRATIAELLQIVPPELIRERTDEYILWEFGHKTWIYSARKSAEGGSLTHVLADEIQAHEYARAWGNIKARARSDRSAMKVAIAVGLAERGHTEDFFREPEDEAGYITFHRLCYPEENPANPPGYAQAIKGRSPGSRMRDKDGWLVRHGARYPKFSTALNIDPARERWPDRKKLTHLPISIGVDFGQMSSVVIAVPVPITVQVGKTDGGLELKEEVGWLAVDQVIVDDCGPGQLAVATKAQIRKMGWHVEPGVSTGCFDPEAVAQELDDFSTLIPGLVHVQTKAGHYHREETGIMCVDWNICDGLGNARFFVHPDLVGLHERGIPESLRGWLTASPKDHFYEHSNDADRYLLVVKSPMPERPTPANLRPIGVPVIELGGQFWRT